MSQTLPLLVFLLSWALYSVSDPFAKVFYRALQQTQPGFCFAGSVW